MKIKKLTGLFVLLLSPVAAIAADQYKPAMFDFSEEQLIEKLSDTSELTSSILYCQSEISIDGVANSTRCYDQEGNVDLVSQTEQAIAELTFSSAIADGEKVPVRMSYRVGLQSSDEGVVAALIPNLGSMQPRYGRDYVAPQERLDRSDWYERYNKNSWVNGEAFLGDGTLSRVAATVNVKGKPDIVRTLDTERAFKRDAKIVKNALKKSRFIPGFVDGKPVPMGYMAVVNYRDDQGGSVASSK